MKKILLYCFAAMVAFGTGCTKWLDVKDPSKVGEPEVYSKEINITRVLNGLYRTLVTDNLYGDKLSAGMLDATAHYYDFPESSAKASSNDMRSMFLICTYDYTNNDIRGEFDKVWGAGYNYILQLNNFIKNMELIAGKGVLDENRRLLYLGEAYGLRALMHLDIYRLYGPVKVAGESGVLPYHVNPAIEMPDYLAPSAYLAAVMADIEKANTLLKENDPIVLDKKVWDGAADDDALDAESRFAKMFRNKRMNYWAVQVLKMRVLTLQDKNAEVITLGNTILTDAVDASYVDKVPVSIQYEHTGKTGAPFGWTNSNNPWLANSAMYDEVIFGTTQLNMGPWWQKHFLQGSSNGDTRVMLMANLQNNILGTGQLDVTSATTIPDYRIYNFAYSSIPSGTVSNLRPTDSYLVATKYIGDKENYDTDEGHLTFYLKDFRGMIRLSEVEYMIAEANLKLDQIDDAATAINRVMKLRKYPASGGNYSATTQLPVGTATKDQVWEMLKREYYREFISEGQVFYFLKRNGIAPFAGNNSGDTPGWSEGSALNYVWVRPLKEQDFD